MIECWQRKSNFLNWGWWEKCFQIFFHLFSLLYFVFHPADFNTFTTALIVQCLLSLITWQDTIKMLLLHHWLVKKNTSMIEIHDYNFTIGLSQVFPNSTIFTYLATCPFAGHLYSSHFWNIWGPRFAETVKLQRWT